MPRQPDYSPSIVHRHLVKQTQPAHAWAGQQGDDLLAWQRKLRAKVKQLIGWHVVNRQPRVPLKARTLWTREHEHGTIHKITFACEPMCDANAYLCLPRNARPPFTPFICLQGHSSGAHLSVSLDRDDQPFAVEGDRDFGIGCMKRGLAALCIEQRGFGEREESDMPRHLSNRCHDATMHALMLGRTLLAERIYDAARGIDYLKTRDDMNLKRLGIMGNSGGGTVSLFAAAILPHIPFAMPSCYFCTFAGSIMSIGHCMDNYVPGLLPVAEMYDVAGLIAPRPIVCVAGRDDPIFPINEVRKAFRKLKDIYKAADAADRFKLVIRNGGHRSYADDVWSKMLKLIA